MTRRDGLEGKLFRSGGGRLSGGGLDFLPAQEHKTDNLSARERYRRFAVHALRFLPEAQAEAMQLYYLEGNTIREIALRTGVNKSTVSRRLYAARRLLQELAQVCVEAGLLPP